MENIQDMRTRSGPGRILVVDREEEAFAAAERLRRLGHEVQVATAGWQVLRALPVFRPQVTLLAADTEQPRPRELIGRILAIDPTASVVLVNQHGRRTSHGADVTLSRLRREALGWGAVACVVTPISDERFDRLLWSAARRSLAARASASAPCLAAPRRLGPGQCLGLHSAGRRPLGFVA
jgi:CheY-like chemotaxis protein